ncbi:MAG: hypothetical protein LBC68_00745 [Prevotellaceae bacterium]|jgi:hypothetical protein|nr:hypothetical protein [Prevotellaceae bacterium]
MKTINKILTVVVLFAAFTACTNESDMIINNKDSKMKVIKDNFWNLQNSDIVIAESVGKYIDIYAPSDFYAGISAQKTDPLQDVFYTSYSGRNKNAEETQSDKTHSNPFSIFADGMKIKSVAENVVMMNKSEKEDLSSLYGKNVKFSIQTANHTQSASSSDSDTTVNMYVPELIEIFSPSVLTKDDMYPLCYYENFILQWNADENNENGVVIVATWAGAMAFGQDHPNIFIRRTDIVPDNGSAVLNSNLFDDIPDTGIVLLTVARGNVENVRLANNDYVYQVTAETHATLPLILIRNIKKLSEDENENE